MSCYSLSDLLNLVVHERAEELEISPGKPPAVQLGGKFLPVEGPAVTTEEAREHFELISTQEQQRELEHYGKVKFMIEFGELARFAIRARITNEEISLQIRTLGRLAG